MSIFKSVSDWFKSVVAIFEHKAQQAILNLENFAEHAWTVAGPFIQAFFKETEQEIIASLRTLAVTAVQQVAQQGLPDNNAKRAAFSQIMQDAAKQQGIQLTESMENWLRETALRIYKDWTATTPPATTP